MKGNSKMVTSQLGVKHWSLSFCFGAVFTTLLIGLSANTVTRGAAQFFLFPGFVLVNETNFGPHDWQSWLLYLGGNTIVYFILSVVLLRVLRSTGRLKTKHWIVSVCFGGVFTMLLEVLSLNAVARGAAQFFLLPGSHLAYVIKGFLLDWQTWVLYLGGNALLYAVLCASFLKIFREPES